MSDTHTMTMPDGKTIDIHFLMELVLSSGLYVRARMSSDIKYSRSARSGFSSERYNSTDVTWPLLLRESDEMLLDGRHRLARAVDECRGIVRVILVPDQLIRMAMIT